VSELQAARRDDREHLEDHARVEMPDVRKPLVRNFAGSSEAIGHLCRSRREGFGIQRLFGYRSRDTNCNCTYALAISTVNLGV